MSIKKRRNPFYVLLIPVGLAFVVTAFAYGMMAFQMVNSTREDAAVHSSHPLFQWLRASGDRMMLIELALLAVLTIAAIATEDWWNPPRERRRDPTTGEWIASVDAEATTDQP